ncbi:MAG: MlaD family protein [Rickettsiales bacterium]|jgi:phospholipid/cholesterol/gamma-HCH transport system substrate-binding protein|nr:MlaD family protein [Rickettsiales bacterium]
MKLTDKRPSQKLYRVYAKFANINGITLGTKVKIGGVDVGNVHSISLEEDHTVLVSLNIKFGIKIPVDSCLKVSTIGLIGGRYLRIDAGGEEEILHSGDRFDFTESAVDLEDMISRFLLERAPNAE